MGVGLAVVALLVALMQGVFCKTWDVTMPQSIVGVVGSCITVPCNFELPKIEEKHIANCSKGGVWRKGSMSGPIVFSEPQPFLSTIQGILVGDIQKKNCTTTFFGFPKNYSDVYFFRVHCSDYMRFTFSTGVSITAQPGLPPSLMTPEKPVSEGDLVTLQCSVPVPCTVQPPTITWVNRDNTWQETTNIRQMTDDGQTVMMSTLTFFASADHHGQSVACSVSYPLTKGGSSEPSAASQRLNILYGPRLPAVTLSPSGPVSEGSTVVLTCSSDANPPVSLYTWYRVHSGQLKKEDEGEMLIVQVRHTSCGVYLCEAQSQRGSQRSRPVSLGVNATCAGSSDSAVVVPYITSGVVLVLFIMIVAVGVCKYQSLSRRLKQIELKEENTYTNLRTGSITADYDQIQMKTKPSPDNDNYENLEELRISKINGRQNGSKGLD
uniref:myelin-associated glycoprotein n=1 Tax=Semicossyphus pulcher TaxID=241346 RepID=UPI0037E96DA2